MSVGRFLQQAAAGAGGASATYVDDVFSTYLYDGTGSPQFVSNGIELSAYPFTKVSSTNGQNVTGSETFSVNVAEGTKLVVFALDSNNSILSCTLDGASLTAKTSSTSWYGVAVFIETLTAGTHTIVVGDNNIGHTEVMLFDSNATVSVETNLNVSAQNATSVTTSAVTTDGFCVFLGSDRDPSANFSSNQTSTEYYDSAHSFFYFGAIGINGSSGTVPATTISGMVGTYATNWCLLKVEGIGNDPTANSAATGKGGMVWIKNRSGTGHGTIFDTERGVGNFIMTSLTNAEASSTAGTRLTAFNSNGFSLGTDPGQALNNSSYDYVSWTFRKQPGFFDIVTYTGDGTNDQAISHNLDSVPGMIIVKAIDQNDSWYVYHRSVGTGKRLWLGSSAAVATSADKFDVAPTSTEFYVGYDGGLNNNGNTFVAYLFAHDAQDFGTDSDESIIKCGSYTGNGTSDNSIDIGFEPQWLLVKNVSLARDWVLSDSMRSFNLVQDYILRTNTSAAESNWAVAEPTATGFRLTDGDDKWNSSGHTFIYVAIRRPHKPASEFAATDLFAIDTRNSTGDGLEPGFLSGFPVDMSIFRTNIIQSNAARVSSRLTTTKYLESSSTNAELTGSTSLFDYMNGWLASAGTSADAYSWMFRRAPGFFDVVAYTGTGATLTLDHNLSVAPEFMIVKGRTINAGWHTYHKDVGNTKALPLNSNGAESTSSFYWNNTSPTDTQVTLGAFSHYNVNNQTGILYLFATVPGISKVGSYSGTGSDVNVNCGFTSGARFVLVKRTDSTGDWYLWDSERGIVAGNDPYLLLNTTAAQVTSTDYIDPLSSGFTVTSSAPAALNASGGTYIFLAIA